jgi:NTP pyrophosphatase (non-canonical NTP hydrolase)
MEFQKIIERAMEVRKRYEQKEIQLYGSPWTSEEIALGFVGDVGDLAKLISAENGKRKILNSHEKLEHKLADCLWSVIVLSELHGVKLEQSFFDTMDRLENHPLGTDH